MSPAGASGPATRRPAPRRPGGHAWCAGRPRRPPVSGAPDGRARADGLRLGYRCRPDDGHRHGPVVRPDIGGLGARSRPGADDGRPGGGLDPEVGVAPGSGHVIPVGRELPAGIRRPVRAEGPVVPVGAEAGPGGGRGIVLIAPVGVRTVGIPTVGIPTVVYAPFTYHRSRTHRSRACRWRTCRWPAGGGRRRGRAGRRGRPCSSGHGPYPAPFAQYDAVRRPVRPVRGMYPVGAASPSSTAGGIPNSSCVSPRGTNPLLREPSLPSADLRSWGTDAEPPRAERPAPAVRSPTPGRPLRGRDDRAVPVRPAAPPPGRAAARRGRAPPRRSAPRHAAAVAARRAARVARAGVGRGRARRSGSPRSGSPRSGSPRSGSPRSGPRPPTHPATPPGPPRPRHPDRGPRDRGSGARRRTVLRPPPVRGPGGGSRAARCPGRPAPR